jgi:hypothetical protein
VSRPGTDVERAARPVLVIAAARQETLTAYLHRSRSRPITVLKREPINHPGVSNLLAPPGRLTWEGLERHARDVIGNTAWAEVVVLHNMGDDSYDHILRIARRAGWHRPLVIAYADGAIRRHRSVAVLMAARATWTLAASLLAPVLMLVASATRAVRGWQADTR